VPSAPPPSGTLGPPGHLWRGDWRGESERAREAAEEEAARRRAAERTRAAREAASVPPAPASRGPRKPALVGFAVALVALAVAGGALVTGSDDPEPLPAVSGSPPKSGQARTRAGAVYAAASPAVVSVRANGGSGTGFLIAADGKLVTNAHVVGQSRSVTVRFGEGDSVAAQVLGTDASSDLAVLSIDAQAVPHGVKPLRFADSRGVRVGDTAIAIGNPFALDRTATEGIVSGLGRQIEAPNGFSIDEVIQTDAPINPGNSGGPLLDASARVIGVNAQIATSGAPGNVGIGFAVPSNTVRQVVPRLSRGERIERAYLGVETSSASSGDGAEVRSVVPGGPADRTGLRAGDVITRVDGRDVNEPADVSSALAGSAPGDEVDIEVERGGSKLTLEATLGTRPDRTP
jgi:putative serine protease PepD